MNKSTLISPLRLIAPAVLLSSLLVSGCSLFTTEVRYENKTRHYTIGEDGDAREYIAPPHRGETYILGSDSNLTAHYTNAENSGAEEYTTASHQGESYTVGPHDNLTSHYILKEGPYDVAQPPPSRDGKDGYAAGAGDMDKEQLERERMLIVLEASDVLFDFDKHFIRKEYYPILDRWADYFKDNPEISAEIYGHTDSIGTEAYNQTLSEKRAEAVFDYLVDQGVAPARLKTRGFGERLPVAPNTTPENRQKNRRVEMSY